jgi:predicted transport protein
LFLTINEPYLTMNLYQTHNANTLGLLKEKPFKLEREIQTLFEKNLSELMGLEMVNSEFVIKGKRIDTLGYDPQSKAFVIIEYKRDKNVSVVDQGFTYLSLMLENKADFVLTYNETLKKAIHSSSIDWSQTRVVFVSPSFTENQRLATNFKDIAIELWEIKRYENDLISINPIKKTKSAESIKPLTKPNGVIQSVTDEIKVYTEEDHLNGSREEVSELYESFKNSILNLADDIEIVPKKLYIAFKKHKNIADIVILKKGLKIFINLKKGQLDDPKGLMKDVSETGHWGNGDYETIVSNTENLEYIMSLVKQAIM